MNNWKLTTNYNNFSKTFSDSRKNMKWEELDYFIEKYLLINSKNLKSILDIGCGNGRFLKQIFNYIKIENIDYTWVDLSVWMIEEAKKNFQDKNFLVLDMLDLDKIEGKNFDFIVFIASFHHLNSIEKRIEVLEKTKKLLKDWWIIFMTNWALESNLNKEKYKNSKLKNTENQFWSSDFSIKIWKFDRFYHCFSISELNYLFEKMNFNILENREFNNEKNIISVVRK